VRSVCLELVDGLQLIEPRPGPGKAQVSGLLHEAQFGVDVFLLLIVAQRVPARQLDLAPCPMSSCSEPAYHALRWPGLVHAATAEDTVSRRETSLEI
jgi:hypothetical protein